MFGFIKRSKKTVNLEAKLSDPNDRWIFGEVELEGFDNGDYRLEIELTAPGRQFSDGLEFRVEGTMVGHFRAPRSRRNDFVRTQRDGELGFDPAIGQRVELWADGERIVSGQFERD